MFLPRLPPTDVIYAFIQDGCEFCAKAEIMLDEFKRAHPFVLILRKNLSRGDWDTQGWKPPYTPGYALVRDGKRIETISPGPVKLKDMERWYRLVTPKELRKLRGGE